VLKSYSDQQVYVDEITTFLTESKVQFAELFNIDYTSYAWNLNLLPVEERTKFSEAYKKIQACGLLNQFIAICDNLIPYRKHIEDNTNLSHKFILNMPGVSFCPFSFTNLNLKELVVRLSTEKRDVNQQLLQVLTLLINKIYTLTYNLYKIMTSPDIDVSQFVEIVKQNLDKVKGQIPRCDKAFKKIEESISMLETNFPKYYKDFVETKNQTIIMENFVLDVANSTNADTQTARQFRDIIKHYRKIAASQIKNPKLKMLFDKVDANFKMLSKHSNINKAEENAESESEDDSVEDPPESKTPENPLAEFDEKRKENAEKSIDDLAREINGEI
jgi:hypothetical protein